MSPPDSSTERFWTPSIIALVAINVVFLLLIGAGLVLAIPPVFSGLQNVLANAF